VRLRRLPTAAAVCSLATLVPSLTGTSSAGEGLPPSRLAVLAQGRWIPWWDSAHAPSAWPGQAGVVAGAVRWRGAAAGMAWGELEIAGRGEAWRLRLVLVRFDPARLRLTLIAASREEGTLADWSLGRLPPGAVLGLNAGQFTGGQPWGWLVEDGRVIQPPAAGALSMAFCIVRGGEVRFVPVTRIPPSGAGDVVEAFQSYPVLLREDGAVPTQLATPDMGVDLAHRDARIAIGQLRDGGVLVALTRFNAAGEVAGSLPFGPTVPEMAAVMGALGCREAMMLDGGISAQLVVRDASGALRRWRGWREVPLALVGFPR